MSLVDSSTGAFLSIQVYDPNYKFYFTNGMEEIIEINVLLFLVESGLYEKSSIKALRWGLISITLYLAPF